MGSRLRRIKPRRVKIDDLQPEDDMKTEVPNIGQAFVDGGGRAWEVFAVDAAVTGTVTLRSRPNGQGEPAEAKTIPLAEFNQEYHAETPELLRQRQREEFDRAAKDAYRERTGAVPTTARPTFTEKPATRGKAEAAPDDKKQI